MSAEPNRGDIYLRFNGIDNYVEIPSSDDFSVSTSGELTVSAWLRPDTGWGKEKPANTSGCFACTTAITPPRHPRGPTGPFLLVPKQNEYPNR